MKILGSSRSQRFETPWTWWCAFFWQIFFLETSWFTNSMILWVWSMRCFHPFCMEKSSWDSTEKSHWRSISRSMGKLGVEKEIWPRVNWFQISHSFEFLWKDLFSILKINLNHIPSLKLTVRTWKWIVSFRDGPFSGAMLVSVRECRHPCCIRNDVFKVTKNCRQATLSCGTSSRQRPDGSSNCKVPPPSFNSHHEDD